MNVVSIEAEHSITIASCFSSYCGTIGYFAFSMIFHFVTRLDYYKKYVDAGNWQKSEIFTHIDMPIFELANKRVEIGRAHV